MNKKNLKIGIDASFVHGENSGTSEYTKQLINYLSKIDKVNKYTIFPFFTYIYDNNFKNYHPNLPCNFNIFWDKIPKNIISFLWKRLHVFRSLFFPQLDVFHTTTFTIPSFHSTHKLIVTIYDVSFYTHPQFHLKENIEHCLEGTKIAVKKADAIITISKNTKSDLIKYFDCPEDKIFVTQLACDNKFHKRINNTKKNKVLSKYKINKPFILHLGSLEPRKNTIGLIKAYCLLPKELQDKFDLVMGGGEGWLNESIYSYVERSNIVKNIKFVGYIADEDLSSFYQSAKCFVYPSFYEGFGIPPLEAMESGCPTLVSNNSSFPEICQKGAIYCVPNSIEDIENQLELLLRSDNHDLIKKGKIQSKKFSWNETAKETLNIYNSISRN